VRGGKYYFSAAKHDPSPMVNRKSTNSQSKKTNDVERKKIKTTEDFQIGRLVRDGGTVGDDQALRH
jgi:hypothetical protein